MKTVTLSSRKIKILDFASVTVAYRHLKSEKEWRCTALQFDIVGTGLTRSQAFGEMQELVNSYLDQIIRSKRKMAFFNPSAREEWEAPDKESYNVFMEVLKPEADIKPFLHVDDVRAIGRKRMGALELVPA